MTVRISDKQWESEATRVYRDAIYVLFAGVIKGSHFTETFAKGGIMRISLGDSTIESEHLETYTPIKHLDQACGRK